MAQFTNTFTVSGFVCNDAKVHDFGSNKLAKFGLSVSRQDERAERGHFSAILNCEAWRKAENAWQFDKHLKKGQAITISGFFCPQEWEDANGTHRSSVVLRVTSIENTDLKQPQAAGTVAAPADVPTPAEVAAAPADNGGIF